MRKTSYYLLLIILLGSAIVSFWAYQRYFRAEETELLFLKVERGSIQEVVKVRGEVAAQKDFDLEFPFSERVERIFVAEGQAVAKDAPLMKLETTDLEIDARRLRAVLAQKKANLDKLLAGATPEDIRVLEAKEAAAKTALEDAKQNVIDKLRDAYTKSDDAVRNKVDQFVSGSKSANPQLNFTVSDPGIESAIESGRVTIEGILASWKTSVENLSVSSGPAQYISDAKKNLNAAASFLNNVTLALAPLTPTTSLTQTVIDTWRADVSTARTNVNTAITNLSTAEEKLKTAESNLKIAEDELALKKSGTRSEEVEIGRAQIQETENQIAATEEKIRKATLRSPAEAKVTKLWLEVGEVFISGEPAVSLSTSGHKIQSDVSELEIGKIREVDGNDVSIRLDAFPDIEFRGKVVSIEPKEVIKDEDVFYRVNVYFDAPGTNVRTGMSADLIILISSRDNVLKIPALAIYERDGKKFVKALDGKKQKETEVKTGISDGESIEIMEGLAEGQTVVVSAD